MKKFFKLIWVIMLFITSIYAVYLVFDHNKPRTRYDPDKSTIVCDNGKSFLMSDFSQDLYKSDREYFRYMYECSDLFGKISFDEYKKNFTENYQIKNNIVYCDNKNKSFSVNVGSDYVATGKSSVFFMYRCSDYSDILAFADYQKQFGHFQSDFKLKEIENHFKQILYTILTILVLALFLYLKAFKKFGKLAIYFKFFIAIGDLSAIIFFIMLFSYLLVSASS